LSSVRYPYSVKYGKLEIKKSQLDIEIERTGKKVNLIVQSRKAVGKDAKLLRRRGIVPLHLYGHGIKSLTLQVNAVELKKVVDNVGTSALLGILVDSAKKPLNVVIREIQRDPMTGRLVHVDFYEVSMAEKIKMEVPILLSGEAPALKSSDNQLVQELETLDIECLPAKIPANIGLDLSSLTEAGKELFVKDIKPVKDVMILNNPEQLVVKITERAAAKPEEKTEVAAAKPEAAAPAPGAETKKE
jgi:large subunit ribosomal protein L25